jgi:hypothetical protein
MNDKDTQGDKQRLAEIDRRLDKLQAQREEKDRPWPICPSRRHGSNHGDALPPSLLPVLWLVPLSGGHWIDGSIHRRYSCW